ncbi:hypothetical protein GALMADRAFT_84345 [Galerina marginata CBS 339.88]|uniref:Ig-like domain-containing protein n=1 Tax=Galerina marginata (strain CBS 339.88) TaxID=685588 RepID=A0A067TQQ4_GALM3|nr:hypothetical protein GALMADRAFT_84345 [Galerina marginata CBS 339.88]
MATATPTFKQPAPNPLIPEKYLDVPSQRLYYLSLGLLCQSIKILDFVWSFAAGDDHGATCRKWLLFDFTYCVILSQLRIPRLNYSKASIILQIGLLWFLDGIMFGGISINAGALLGSVGISSGLPDVTSTSEGYGFLALLGFGIISSTPRSRDAHLLGQHTVRMSPISTAYLNPQNLNYCLSPSIGFVLVPIVMNNTNVAGLKYSVTPLGYDGSGRIDTHELSSKELKSIEQQYRDKLQAVTQAGPAVHSADDYDEYDDDDDDVESQTVHSKLQHTQSLAHIILSRPGVIRLERVYDTSNADARLIASEAVVVPCPHVEFAEDTQQPIRCAGQESSPQLKIDVHGVPPLSLRWLRTVNGNRESFLVEGIEGDHKGNNKGRVAPSDSINATPIVSSVPTPQDVVIPLTVSLEQPGTYLYALEEITDGVGNAIRVGLEAQVSDGSSVSKTKTTRSFMVLQKPAFSFSHCSTDSPMSLLIGSETSLGIKTTHADPFDAPWDINLAYQPLSGGEAKGIKVNKPWRKTLKIQGDEKDLSFRVNTPGEYKVLGVKGKYCTGTVLAPDTCKVIQKPMPSAEIEWKRIHECSGDTGVSASIVLHGTPPFQIYYRMQRDNEPAREISKTFTTSRAELTLQPERSGHYNFVFTYISDANYRKVELLGPSIDQIIHPVASADFSDSHGIGRGKRILSTCSGVSVDIDVDLKGTGPWNLEIQVIGPQTTENILIQGIEKSKKTIKVPIPKELESTSGSFEIDLVSVEDASQCKRPLSAPGVEVKVKRVVPTVRFYGTDQERRVVVTENERASLPLRLTGDGPWRIKYRRRETGNVLTTTLHDRNSNLQVTEKGVYEIQAVADSQCPGTVAADASTYIVDWIPRPSAKLSPSTPAIYETHNGSHILRPICEGVNDHVDLELTGRPPFEIMYNIAQDNEMGGTKILGQPTFNSIQPHTRFQLHTSTPGRMYYEVKQVGDAAYPLSKHNDLVIPRSQRLLFEQQVSVRPSARFRNRNRLAYCLNDALVPVDPVSTDGFVILEGTAPFTVELSIKNIAASHIEKKFVQVPTNTWRLNLPDYTFISIGPHLLTIEKVTDSSSCEQATLDPLLRSIWVDVAETAAIIPFERREDICVGDVTQFQLEGIPPWTIAYKTNGKSYTQEAKTSPFSLLQQQPGLFTVTSIAHQQKMCKAAVTDLRFKVHDLPSAQVGHGKKIFQDIHEGDQAEIVFTLIGEPPFTFTYQRSELAPKGGIGKVLETHTVSRVHANEYSIFSALEGTWTVTSISDRYCRYPPAKPDLVVEKRN